MIVTVIRHLFDNGVLQTEENMRSTRTSYKFNNGWFQILKALGVLENIVYGFSYAHDRYLPAIPIIKVYDREENRENAGTGVLVRYSGKNLILTNKHVVNPDKFDILSVQSSSGGMFEVASRVVIPDEGGLDLACFEVETAYNGPSVPLSPLDPIVLDSIVSVGYPKVTTVDDYALSHRGEVNAYLDSFRTESKIFIFSCNIAPGNSGGPVLNKFGMCVGIVMEHLSDQDSMQPYNCAIPITTVIKFLQNIDWR